MTFASVLLRTFPRGPALAAIGFLAAVAVALMLPLDVWFGALQSWASGPGWWTFSVFILIYVTATATVFPAAPFSVASGLLFGFPGVVLSLAAATGGAVPGFYLGRVCFRDRIARLVAERPLLMAVDHAIAQQGWRIVCLVRLSPLVPFNVQNYLFGVTQIPLVPYVLATTAGILPNTVLCVYLGTLGRTSIAAAGPAALVVPAFGVLCSVLAVVVTGRAARRSLLRMVAAD